MSALVSPASRAIADAGQSGVGLIRDRAIALVHQVGEGVADMAAEGLARAEDAETWKAASEALSPSPRRGRRPIYDDEHLRRIAQAHLETVRELGTTRGARKVLAERERVSESTIRDWLHEARNRGYLPRTRRGKATLLPGPRLVNERKDNEEEE